MSRTLRATWCCALLLATTARADPAHDRRRTAHRHGAGYAWHCRGNPAPVAASPRGGTLLAGGGTDVDDAFRWFVARAGGGDVVVLRASGGDGYDDYLYDLGRVDSVETLVIDDAAGAAAPFVLERVRAADAVFLAGGDQWDYLRLWTGAPLRDALQSAIDRGAVIGGTSAGMAVLGEHAFTASHDTVDSPAALRDPCDARVDLARGFLRVPHLGGVITDTHFGARDRMGRLLAFMYRIAAVGVAAVRAIAADEETALLVDPDGAARVVGQGHVYMLSLRGGARRAACGRPLTVRGVTAQRVSPGEGFDVARWRGPGAAYRLDVVGGDVRAGRGATVYGGPTQRTPARVEAH